MGELYEKSKMPDNSIFVLVVEYDAYCPVDKQVKKMQMWVN